MLRFPLKFRTLWSGIICTLPVRKEAAPISPPYFTDCNSFQLIRGVIRSVLQLVLLRCVIADMACPLKIPHKKPVFMRVYGLVRDLACTEMGL